MELRGVHKGGEAETYRIATCSAVIRVCLEIEARGSAQDVGNGADTCRDCDGYGLEARVNIIYC